MAGEKVAEKNDLSNVIRGEGLRALINFRRTLLISSKTDCRKFCPADKTRFNAADTDICP